MAVEGILNPFSIIIEEFLVSTLPPLKQDFALFLLASTYLFSLTVREKSEARFSGGLTTLDELIFFGGSSILIGITSYEVGFAFFKIIPGSISSDLVTVSNLSGLIALLVPLAVYLLSYNYDTSIPKIFNKLRHYPIENESKTVAIILSYYIGLTLILNIASHLVPHGDLYTFIMRFAGVLSGGPIILLALFGWTTFYFEEKN